MADPRPGCGPSGRVALVTGANKGIGKQTARRLLAAGHTVYLGARDADRGRRTAEELGAETGGTSDGRVRLLLIDVTDDASVTAAANQVRSQVGHLDVLVNNAADTGSRNDTPAGVSAEDLRAVHETNVVGLVRVTRAFLPLLHTSPAPVVVNVSSGMGSLTRVTDSTAIESRFVSLAYASSKAAVNMLTVQYAKALPGMRINAVDPGLAATDGSGQQGKPIAKGAEAAVRMALVGPDGPTGTFTDLDAPVPW